MRIVRWLALILLIVVAGCSSPTRFVSASDFSFANYDYVVVAKPLPDAAATSIYGMDVDLANLLTWHNMKVIGDVECEALSADRKARALHARIAVTASRRVILVTISFDDVVTGQAKASVTSRTRGSIARADHRADAFGTAADRLIWAIQTDRGTRVVDDTSGH
jgi:hypothetical protein